MTVTEDGVDVSADTGTDAAGEDNGEETAEEKKRGRDFTKVRPYHEQLAEFVNARSGLDAVTPNQIKAILALRTDYGNTDEAKAARAARAAERKAEAEKYAGMTDAQKTAAKASKRAQDQAERLQKKADEAIARAQKLALEASGSGEDLQQVIQSAQNGDETNTETEPAKGRRGLGSRRR
jgi:hypothetical protein